MMSKQHTAAEISDYWKNQYAQRLSGRPRTDAEKTEPVRNMHIQGENDTRTPAEQYKAASAPYANPYGQRTPAKTE